MDSQDNLNSVTCHEWQDELVEMDLPQLDEFILTANSEILKLTCELDGVESFIDQSKFELFDSVLSTLVARELEREHWAIEVRETKKMLAYDRSLLQEAVSPSEEEIEESEDNVRHSLKELERLEPTLVQAEENEKNAKEAMVTAQQKLQDALDVKGKLELKILKLEVDRATVVKQRELHDQPPCNFLILRVSKNC